MIEDLMGNDVDLSEIRNPNGGSTGGYNNYQQQQQQNNNQQSQQQQPQQQNGYQQQPQNNNQQQHQQQNGYQQRQNNGYQGNNNGGGYKPRQNGGGGGNWNKKEDVVEDPYVPVTIYIDREFPAEIKQQLIGLASRLINKGIVVRYNADDLDIHTPLSEMSRSKTEAYTPWKGFNSIETKHYYNTETAKHMASTNFQGWEKIPDAVKSMLARNVRMIFGDKNRSPTMCLITWSPDGATRAAEVTKDTGRAGFVIKLASMYGFSVVNLGKPNAESLLEKAFNL